MPLRHSGVYWLPCAWPNVWNCMLLLPFRTEWSLETFPCLGNSGSASFSADHNEQLRSGSLGTLIDDFCVALSHKLWHELSPPLSKFVPRSLEEGFPVYISPEPLFWNVEHLWYINVPGSYSTCLIVSFIKIWFENLAVHSGQGFKISL